jgi:hypothetical protein
MLASVRAYEWTFMPGYGSVVMVAVVVVAAVEVAVVTRYVRKGVWQAVCFTTPPPLPAPTHAPCKASTQDKQAIPTSDLASSSSFSSLSDCIDSVAALEDLSLARLRRSCLTWRCVCVCVCARARVRAREEKRDKKKEQIVRAEAAAAAEAVYT